MIRKKARFLFSLFAAALLLGACDSSSDLTGVNNAPLAHAGLDVEVDTGQLVVLDSSRSQDPDRDKLSFSWSLVAAPLGSQAQLNAPAAPNPGKPGKEPVSHPSPYLTPDLPGVYVAALTVYDGSIKSQPDEVIIRASAPGVDCGLASQFEINTAQCHYDSNIPWKALSDCAPDAQGNLAIGSGEAVQYVYVDETGQGAKAFKDISINQGGRLVFLDRAVSVQIGSIHVSGGSGNDGLPKGQLVAGTAQWPIQNNDVRIVFQGARPSDTTLDQKGIFVKNNGELVLRGKKGTPAQQPAQGSTGGTVSWTYLQAPAGPAAFDLSAKVLAPVPDTAPDTTLTLATKVDWGQGDWIVVAGTGYVDDQSEFVQIDSVDNSGATSVVHLNPQTPLVHYHFGSLAPSQGTIPPGTSTCNGVDLIGDAKVDGLPASFCDGPEKNYGVDERAEVGLVSRNITLTSDAETTSTKHYGGQIHVGPQCMVAEIEGVRIEKFGQDVSDSVGGVKVGAYPLLLDSVDGAAVGASILVNANSIHHSYNKAIALRGARNVLVQNNVAARIVGHGVYLETGNESGNTLDRNLMAGAQATGFAPAYFQTPPPGWMGATCFADTPPAGFPKWDKSFWKGDYLGNAGSPSYNGFDSFDVLTTSSTVAPDNRLENQAPCNFFLTNPNNSITNNSAAGCQLQGRGFWLLPATATTANLPLAEFSDNRAHGCYTGIDNAADLGGMGFNHTPSVNDLDVFALYQRVTATRMRNRGIWLRPAWNVILDARLAANRAGASLVSAGGAEGSPPGEWGLLKDSVLVGLSQNNPERFGPCPCPGTDGTCYGVDPALAGHGVPDPFWNLGGYMFYDGPARLENNRFVNFNADDNRIKDMLTTSDYNWIGDIPAGKIPGKTYPDDNGNGVFHYEGDAAQMWFQSNINGYPPTQYSMGNTWENTDFRHQVYTEETFLAAFTDGDKNTVIVDRDGSLTGYHVYSLQGGQWVRLENKFAISLNNLAFNGSPLSVDECSATGRQDAGIENRSTSLISPQGYGRLVINGYYPSPTFTGGPTQRFPFTLVKDTVDYTPADPAPAGYTAASTWRGSGHPFMTLGGRNDTQNRELQVMNGMGYTIHADDECYSQDNVNHAPCKALPRYMGMMFTDADLTDKEINGNVVQAAPFRIRVGLCYKTAKNDMSANLDPETFFEIQKGRISLGGPTGSNTYGNWQAVTGCNNYPQPGNASWDPEPDCPGTMDSGTDPVITLTAASSYAEFTAQAANPDSPLDKYWWDQDKGMLFFYMEQKKANLKQASPLGKCTGAADDPPECGISNQPGKKVDFFYSCPEEGCVLYTVRVQDGAYDPDTMGCTDCGDVYQAPGSDYTQTFPPNDTVTWELDRLGLAQGGTVVSSDLITKVPDNWGKYFDPNNFPCGGNNPYLQVVNKNFPYNLPDQSVVPPDCPLNSNP